MLPPSLKGWVEREANMVLMILTVIEGLIAALERDVRTDEE